MANISAGNSSSDGTFPLWCLLLTNWYSSVSDLALFIGIEVIVPGINYFKVNNLHSAHCTSELYTEQSQNGTLNSH